MKAIGNWIMWKLSIRFTVNFDRYGRIKCVFKNTRDAWSLFDQILVTQPLLEEDFSSFRFYKACGSLLALRLGQRGFKVRVIEMRQDLRKVDISAGRSINLAFSNRGLKAIKLVGLESKVESLCIPMHEASRTWVEAKVPVPPPIPIINITHVF